VIGRYKKTVVDLLQLLRQFQTQPKNTASLADIQRKLYRAICNVERRSKRAEERAAVARHSLRTGRLPKVQAKHLKRRIESLTSSKQGYKNLIYLLKSVGDGLAFTIFDRYDLKPLAFKQSPGSLSGKAGRRKELHILHALLKKNIRVILCDLTNVLRYGDICAEKFKLPLPLEIKSSRNENARTDRQIKNLGNMISYLHTDEMEGLYGRPGITKRVALTRRQRGYAHVLGEIIESAEQTNFAAREVELGVHYVVMRHFRASEFEKYFQGRGKSVQFALLNSDKYSGAWAPFFPFVLSIDDVEQCFGFAAGAFSILVHIDLDEAVRIAKRRGFALTFDKPKDANFPDHITDDDWLWWFKPIKPSVADYFAVGPHMIGRLFFEFASLKWLIASSVDRLPASLSAMIEEQVAKRSSSTPAPTDTTRSAP
jgi:hypothetical protein